MEEKSLEVAEGRVLGLQCLDLNEAAGFETATVVAGREHAVALQRGDAKEWCRSVLASRGSGPLPYVYQVMVCAANTGGGRCACLGLCTLSQYFG